LAQEFSPITDMRASADYRRKLLQQLLQRAWLEQQGHAVTQLGDLS
jgi:xanthine dehydrogenase small subunit